MISCALAILPLYYIVFTNENIIVMSDRCDEKETCKIVDLKYTFRAWCFNYDGKYTLETTYNCVPGNILVVIVFHLNLFGYIFYLFVHTRLCTIV